MPEIKIYKLYATVTATADAAASYDVQEDGEICSILLDQNINSADALNDGIDTEVSFSSVSGFTSNDTRASLIGKRSHQHFLTSGGGPVGGSSFITFAPFGIPVSAGERLYLHILLTGTALTAYVNAWLYHCLGRSASPRGRVGRRVR